MRVKCKICNLKGFYDGKAITEFWASRFMRIRKGKFKDFKSDYICRNCVCKILDSLRYESNRIDDLYKPEIKDNVVCVKGDNK